MGGTRRWHYRLSNGRWVLGHFPCTRTRTARVADDRCYGELRQLEQQVHGNTDPIVAKWQLLHGGTGRCLLGVDPGRAQSTAVTTITATKPSSEVLPGQVLRRMLVLWYLIVCLILHPLTAHWFSLTRPQRA